MKSQEENVQDTIDNEETQNTNESAPPIDETNEQPVKEIESLLSEIQEKEKAQNDRYLRLQAEFENYRRRTAREQMELIETANAKLLEKLSEVVDNFDRAFAEENKTSDAEAFEKGMQLIHDQFNRILTECGLESISPLGEEFDPNIHEALMKQPSDEYSDGYICAVFQKGYRLKSKILKTARVIVSSGPAQTNENKGLKEK